MNLKQESFWTKNTSTYLLMVQNSKLIQTLMVRRYANVNLKKLLTVTVRDSTMPKMLLGVMTPTETATYLVTTFTKSTVGVFTTKRNYLRIS
jgi:hypothetical protein